MKSFNIHNLVDIAIKMQWQEYFEMQNCVHTMRIDQSLLGLRLI